MKYHVLLIACSLLLLTISCQNMGTSPSTGDYYAGKFAGETAAKQDALNIQDNIGQTSMKLTTKKNITRHLKQMKQSMPAAYIKGFKWGYQRAYGSYNDTYNGGG